MASKTKLKWFREGHDKYEDLYLIPVGQERDAEGDLSTDAAVAWIKIAYDRTRFYGGRGGEGESRPDSYVAMIREGNRSRVVAEGADDLAYVGGLFSTKPDKAFSSLRAAKQAIANDLAKRGGVPKSPAQIEEPKKKSAAQLQREIDEVLRQEQIDTDRRALEGVLESEAARSERLEDHATKKRLPNDLYAAYEWTRAAGELDQLKRLTGKTLDKYAREAVANAREHDVTDVSAADLKELAVWLREPG